MPMPMNVNDIFIRKLSEIQSRVPLKIQNKSSQSSFRSYLHTAMGDADTARPLSTTGGINTSKVPVYPASPSKEIDAEIEKAAVKYRLDPHLIRAVMNRESGFNPAALSIAGAQGLMQLMPATARYLNVKNPWDIGQNIDGGARFLREQLDRFGGDVKLALAAYNAGPDNVIKYRGIPPFDETRNYVVNVLDDYKQYTSAR